MQLILICLPNNPDGNGRQDVDGQFVGVRVVPSAAVGVIRHSLQAKTASALAVGTDLLIRYTAAGMLGVH